MTVPAPNPVIDSLAAAISPFAARLESLYGKAEDRGLDEAEHVEFAELRGMARRLIASHIAMLLGTAIAAGEWPEGMG
jgi:hypothetical protein